MKRYLLLIIFAYFSANLTYAQTPADSLAIVSIKWETQKIKKGVIWKSALVNLYDSPQSINILEVKPSKRNKLGIAYCVDTLIATSTLCKQINASGGVNASFFDMKNGGSVDHMRVNGEIIHDGRDAISNSNSAITIDGSKISIIPLANGNEDARQLTNHNILVAGPMLVTSHTMETLQETSFNTTRHPRTCAAITDSGKLLLITVDGRHKDNAAGMSTKELAYLVKILGAKDAMNFDGGGSTAMYVNGYGESGIVNYPSDNKTFDHKGERKVANVVYLK